MMKDAWERWGWLVALAACALFVLRMLWGRDAFCGPESEQCLREWLSATGGWVALAIGVPSLFALRQQLKAAIAANENNAKIQLRRNYALAKKTQMTSFYMHMQATSLASSVKKRSDALFSQAPTGINVAFQLDIIVDMFARGAFDKFEEEIEYTTPFSADYFRRSARELKRSLDPRSDAILSPKIRGEVLKFCDLCLKYNEFCRRAADDFIKEADQMKGTLHADALDGTS